MPTYAEAIADPDIVGLEEISPHPNFLVFGNSGCGKTVLGGSDERVLFISTESEGCLSAKRLGSTAKQVLIKTWDDFERFLAKAQKWGESDTGIPFTWFVIDSITELQNLNMEAILEDKGKIVEEWPEYRKNQKMIIRAVKQMNELPVNVLWLALARKETDTDGEEFDCPEIHGKGYGVAMMVAAAMTSYGYMEVKSEKVPMMRDGKKVVNPKTGKPRVELKTHRFIFWQDIGTVKGKDRTLALAPYTKDLTLKDIRQRVEKAFAEVGKDKDNRKER